MAHVNCPNCGKRLRFSDTSDPVRIRCPICKHTFRATAGSALTSQTSPASQSPVASDYSEANLGWVAKASIIVMAMAGTALLAFLVYKVANTSSPGLNEEPSHEIVQAVKTGENSSTPTTMIAPTTSQLPQVTSKPAAMSPEKLFAKASPAVVYIVVRDGNFKPTGLGSGFFVDAKGLIVTNYHVIKGAVFATARLSNGTTLFVDGVAATDPDSDVALLKVSGPGFPFLKIAAGPLPKVGSAVYAIGNPQGLENTFSGGMVSGHREIKKGFTAIQVTTPISPGSSGGPLLNARGKVVGVTTAYLKGGQNLNFAVPVAAVRQLIQRQGKVQTLASAGGGRLGLTESQELDKAWEAIVEKDWRGASEILIRLRKLERDNPFVWFALGYLHRKLGNNDIAIQHYKQAITLKPDYAEAYFFIGVSYTGLNRRAEAIAAYKQAIALKPDYAAAYFRIGLTLNRYPEAIAAYKKAIAIKHDYADAYYFMGNAYMLQSYKGLEKKYPEALAAYKAAVAFKPDYADAYYGMGNAYQGLEKHSEAIKAFKKSIALKPDYAAAYFNMGSIYEKLGQRDAALAAYQQSLRLEPTGRFANLARKGIRRLGNQWDIERMKPE